MKKIFLLSIMYILILSSVTAQENKENLKEYTLPPFTGIDAGSLSNVYITMGNVQSVKMEKDEEQPEDMNTIFKVRNGILEIRNTVDGSEHHLKNEKIYICCPNLSYVKASGVSRIKSMNKIKTDSLEITASGASKIEMDIDVKYLKTDISGAAKLTLKGNSIQHIASLNGAAKLSANEIEVFDMQIEGSGVAKANVNVKNKLYGDMTGVSSVNFEKKPDTINLSTVNINNDSFGNRKSSENHRKVEIYDDEDTPAHPSIEIDGDEITDTNALFTIGNSDFITIKNKHLVFRNPHDKHKTHRFRGHWAGFELGYNIFSNKNLGTVSLPSKYEFLQLNERKSIVVNLNLFNLNANIINNRFGVVSGVGIQWNNYRFGDNVVLSPDSASIYGYHNTTINSYIKSKLVESWVRIPVFLEYQTAQKKWKQFHLAVGGVFGYKIGSHSKQVNFDGGDKNKDKIYNDFYLNPIRLDAELRIGWGPCNMFFSYALTPLFKDQKGPEVYAFMVGATLASW